MDISVYVLLDRYKDEYDRDIVGIYSNPDELAKGFMKYMAAEFPASSEEKTSEMLDELLESYECGGFTVEKMVLDKTYGSSGDGIP